MISQKITVSAIVITFLYFAGKFLYRDLWFDEAVTLLNFALLPDAASIYRNYAIPNNHILYTILLHYWLIWAPAGLDPVFWMRLLSMMLGAATLLSMYFLFKTGLGGRRIITPVVIALGISLPFLVYATAVRGYMLGALLLVWVLYFAREYSVRQSWRNLARYVIALVLLVGTVPTNLLGALAVILYVLPQWGANFYKKRQFYWLVLAPLLAALVFYLPIWRQLLGCFRLGEGWDDSLKVLQAVYAALLYSFAMLIFMGIGAVTSLGRNNYNYLRTSRFFIWLLPIPAALLLSTPPFPRVFFQLWPIYALLITAGLRDVSAIYCRLNKRWNQTAWLLGILAIVLLWGVIQQYMPLQAAFSRRNGNLNRDDFFYCYYMRPTHCPDTTAARLKKEFPDGVKTLYATFAADPWPLMYYCNANNFNVSDFRFDGPAGPVKSLPANTVIVDRFDQKIENTEQRFNIRTKLLWSTLNHHVYVVR